MAKGLQAAIDTKLIVNITELQAKRAARNQLLDPGADGVQATDVINPSEMVFLAAIGEIPTEDMTSSTTMSPTTTILLSYYALMKKSEWRSLPSYLKTVLLAKRLLRG